MNKYITTTLTLLLGALIATVAIFWFASASPWAGDNLRSLQQRVQSGVTETREEKNDEGNSSETATNSSITVPEGGIPLSSLPLTDQQKNALSGVGIDVNTFVLTQPMLECGAGKIGEARIEAIVGGEAPTFMETTKMLPCLGE